MYGVSQPHRSDGTVRVPHRAHRPHRPVRRRRPASRPRAVLTCPGTPVRRPTASAGVGPTRSFRVEDPPTARRLPTRNGLTKPTHRPVYRYIVTRSPHHRFEWTRRRREDPSLSGRKPTEWTATARRAMADETVQAEPRSDDCVTRIYETAARTAVAPASGDIEPVSFGSRTPRQGVV